MRLYIYIMCTCLLSVLAGCATKERVITKTNTEYRDRSEYVLDSIFVHDSVAVFGRSDTVFVEKYRTKWRCVTMRDTVTVAVVRTDSVVVPVEVAARMTRYQRFCVDNYTRHVVVLLLLLAGSVGLTVYTRRKTP